MYMLQNVDFRAINALLSIESFKINTIFTWNMPRLARKMLIRPLAPTYYKILFVELSNRINDNIFIKNSKILVSL